LSRTNVSNILGYIDADKKFVSDMSPMLSYISSVDDTVGPILSADKAGIM